jgi:hypothetical protein
MPGQPFVLVRISSLSDRGRGIIVGLILPRNEPTGTRSTWIAAPARRGMCRNGDDLLWRFTLVTYGTLISSKSPRIRRGPIR